MESNAKSSSIMLKPVSTPMEICTSIKDRRQVLFGFEKFQEPKIKISGSGYIKSLQDKNPISLQEQTIVCELKRVKSKKEGKETEKRNLQIYRRKFNHTRTYGEKKVMEAQIKNKNMKK